MKNTLLNVPYAVSRIQARSVADGMATDMATLMLLVSFVLPLINGLRAGR